MNKSTPLAQLPNNNQNQPTFVNDQQRQFITQAQNAIANNNHIPQNTQMSSDIINDDDVVVQDILNEINASSSSNNNDTQFDQNMQQQNMQQQNIQQQNIQQQNQNQYMQQQNQNQYMQQQNMQQVGGYYDNIADSNSLDLKTYIIHFADDLKLAGLIFFVTILVHFIPFDKLVSKYIIIDKIPYHDILFRAIMAAIFVIIIKKLIKI